MLADANTVIVRMDAAAAAAEVFVDGELFLNFVGRTVASVVVAAAVGREMGCIQIVLVDAEDAQFEEGALMGEDLSQSSPLVDPKVSNQPSDEMRLETPRHVFFVRWKQMAKVPQEVKMIVSAVLVVTMIKGSMLNLLGEKPPMERGHLEH